MVTRWSVPVPGHSDVTIQSDFAQSTRPVHRMLLCPGTGALGSPTFPRQSP